MSTRFWEGHGCIKGQQRGRQDHPGRFARQSPETAVPPCERPEDLMVIVAGGPGKHAAIVPTFGSTRPITARVEA